LANESKNRYQSALNFFLHFFNIFLITSIVLSEDIFLATLDLDSLVRRYFPSDAFNNKSCFAALWKHGNIKVQNIVKKLDVCIHFPRLFSKKSTLWNHGNRKKSILWNRENRKIMSSGITLEIIFTLLRKANIAFLC